MQVKKNQDNKLNQENISQDNTLLENSETVNLVKEDDVIENIDKNNTQNSASKNLLSLTFIPQKNKFDFSNMSYRFVLFYSALFFIIYFGILYNIAFIDYKSISREIISPEELTVDKKLHSYTNINELAGYYKEGYNLYRRLKKYKESELRFLHDMRVPANNSLCERLARVYKRKQKQAITLRSQKSLEYICDGLSIVYLLRSKEKSVYKEICNIYSRKRPIKSQKELTGTDA